MTVSIESFFLIVLGIIIIFLYATPDLYPRVLRPVLKKGLYFVRKVLKWASEKVVRAAIVMWNSPDKILLFIPWLLGRIFVGLVTFLEIIVRAVPKIPSFIIKALTFLWRPDSEEKNREEDLLEDMLSKIQGYQFGPPLSELELHHLFYIGYYNYYSQVAPHGVVEKALGAYIIRQDMKELPFWMKSFVRQYKSDRSLEQMALPFRPKIRRSLVSNWFKKNPRAVCTIDDFEALPWQIRALTNGYCREKIHTIRLIEHYFKISIPPQQRTDIFT